MDLSLIYWLVLVAGVIIMATALALDGLIHFGDEGSITPAIGFFMLMFGATGVVSLNMLHLTERGSFFTSLGISTVGALGFYFGLLKLIHTQENTLSDRREDLVGKTAEVSVPIPADGMGQITFTTPSGRTTGSARSENGTTIRQGALVEVVQSVGTTYVVRTARTSASSEVEKEK
ncbi:hypothetical protein BH09SUM1_BH09SUM1_26040 [soil metagenome]